VLLHRNDAFTPRHLNRYRQDALINEVVSASPYIANIYGRCGGSGLFDFSEGGDLRNMHLHYGNPRDLLKVSHRLAASIADLHHVDELGRATIVHNDLDPEQMVMIDGEYYLTDFNKAILLTLQSDANKTRPFSWPSNDYKVSIRFRCYGLDTFKILFLFL
jgi:aminoglycoside phosphotransferase (APT) family kinase protein